MVDPRCSIPAIDALHDEVEHLATIPPSPLKLPISDRAMDQLPDGRVVHIGVKRLGRSGKMWDYRIVYVLNVRLYAKPTEPTVTE